MRGASVAVALVLIALSGCLSGDPKVQATDDESGSSCTASANATAATITCSSGTKSGNKSGSLSGTSSNGPGSGNATGNGTSNAAPVIQAFTANATGLVVSFAFNASDANGGSLTYVLAFGDASANATGTLTNGIANATYTYAAAGTYNATLTISDGTASPNKTIAVTASSSSGGPPQHYEGEWTAGAFSCGLRPGARGSIYHDNFIVETDVEAHTWGRAFTGVFEPTPGTKDVILEFMNGAYGRIGASMTATAAPWTITGTVPDDAVSVRFTSCGAAGGAVTYDTA